MRAVLTKSLSGRGLLTFAAAFVFALAIPPLASTASAEDEAGEVNDFSGGDLSSQQKLDFAERAASELNTATARILSLIEEAQRQKDVLLLNCLNDKLINLRGLLKVAADSELNLAEAIARENQDQQEHNYRKVAIADDQSKLIIAEAEACVGDLGFSQSGGTVVSVTVEGGNDKGDDDFGNPTASGTRPRDSSPDN